VVSGDTAFSGKLDEYTEAKLFFSNLGNSIRELNKDVELAFAFVPGNHDCYLPPTTIALRQALIAGIVPTIDTNEPDQEILNQLLFGQSPYFTFQDEATSRPGSADQRLCKTELITLKGIKLQVNLYNTALLSQRDEKQGELRVPVAIFDLNVRPIEEASFTVAILHHTYTWLESNNSVQFRRHIDDNADLVLSGHQHFDCAFIKQNLDGPRALYLEGAALQDESNPTVSGFNIIELDIPNHKQRVVHFTWKKDHYAATVDPDWTQLVENRSSRHEFRVSEDFQRFLNDPGAGYTHNRKREIYLRDIYVYPDLSVRRPLGKPNVAEVSSEGFHEYLRTADHVVFEGEGQSGRTALARITFSDLLNGLGYVPVFLDGRGLRPVTETAFVRRIAAAVQDQYGAADLVERFGLLDKAKRVLIVDDWHKAVLNAQARADFLALANKYFKKVFLFSDAIFDVQEFATRAKDQTAILHFEHATIQQFGYKARGTLIEKWLTLGREHSHDVEQLIREIDEIENTVTTLLGKNTLPKFPFIVLSVLQAHQEKKTARAEAGSYGYVYEVLITTALATTAKSPSDIDKKYTFLAHLAYRMFKSGTDTLSYAEIISVAEEYLRAYGLRVAPDPILSDLIAARVLNVREGNYRFQYSYYFEYFVARYYKDSLQNPNEHSSKLFDELRTMASQISFEQYSKILMFFLYFTKNAELIGLLIHNAGEVLKEYEPATLAEDVEFANALYDEPPTVELPAGSVQEHREARRQTLDDNEKKLPASAGGQKITYADTLDFKDKLDIATNHLQLLGQILRNFPGSLKAEAKLEIAKSTYLLGLRIIEAILSLLHEAVAHYKPVFEELLREQGKDDEHAKDDTREGLEKLEELADRLFLLMARLGALGLIKKVSFSVGSPELDQTYMDVVGALPNTNAVRLVDLSIRLDHFPGFPEGKVRELNKDLKDNTFVHQILTDLVVLHMTFFEVDYKIRQSIGSLLDFRASHPRLLGQRPKLIKGSKKQSED